MAGVPGLNERAPRIDLRRPAVLINSDGVELDVTILDVSNGGFRLEVLESVRIGEMVTLRVGTRRGVSGANSLGAGQRGRRCISRAGELLRLGIGGELKRQSKTWGPRSPPRLVSHRDVVELERLCGSVKVKLEIGRRVPVDIAVEDPVLAAIWVWRRR
jgi:hypothetical protein